jgi:hypothetical protein
MTEEGRKGPFFNWVMDENYDINGEKNGCYCDIHEAFRAIKEQTMWIYFENEEDEVLRVSYGFDEKLFNSKEDEIKLLPKKLMDIGKRCFRISVKEVALYVEQL